MAAVQPIRRREEIERIEDILFAMNTPHGNRMFVMFEAGIYLGLRIGDMLKLTVGDIRGQQYYTFTPEKTDTRRKKGGEANPKYRAKKITVTIAPELRNVVRHLYAGKPDDWPLFPSRQRGKGRPKPITRQTARNDMREIGKLAGLDYRIGCHTLRKTFGYHIYQQRKDVAWLQTWFQHSSAAVTLIYIGIADDEKKSVTDAMPYGNRGRFDWNSKTLSQEAEA